jgi:hypothetical protein
VSESCVARITNEDGLLLMALRLSRSGGVSWSRVQAGYQAGIRLQHFWMFTSSYPSYVVAHTIRIPLAAGDDVQ